METLNSPISDWKRKRLAVLIEYGSSENLTELMIMGIDRIELNLPSLKTNMERDAALELYIGNQEAKLESKYEQNRAESFKEMLNDTLVFIDRQGNFIEKISDSRIVQDKTINELQNTLLQNEKPTLN